MGFREAVWFWFKLGFISFGGPAGQISLMHDALVSRMRVIPEQRFLHALNFCMLLPGPEAQQLATYLGWFMHRTLGGFIAGLFFILPSFFILVGISTVYVMYGTLPLIAGLFMGVQAAVLALVLQASLKMGLKALKTRVLWGIAGLSLVAAALDIPFPWIILGAALLGVLNDHILARDATPHLEASTRETSHATPPFKLQDSLTVFGLGLLAWVLPMAVLAASLGLAHPLTEMGLFFSKAALLTFGGAYAVLPYVFEATVHQFHWLTLPQMMDGMGLGETTPGPLIMVVTYVGFVAAYTHHFLAEHSAFASGVAGALVATWFTFLPSFVFIFAGAPLVEASQNIQFLKGPMRAITAAVVGVILHLALFFAVHLIFPVGLTGAVAWPSLLMSLAALIALVRFKVPAIPVILTLGSIGILLKLFL